MRRLKGGLQAIWREKTRLFYVWETGGRRR